MWVYLCTIALRGFPLDMSGLCFKKHPIHKYFSYITLNLWGQPLACFPTPFMLTFMRSSSSQCPFSGFSLYDYFTDSDCLLYSLQTLTELAKIIQQSWLHESEARLTALRIKKSLANLREMKKEKKQPEQSWSITATHTHLHTSLCCRFYCVQIYLKLAR